MDHGQGVAGSGPGGRIVAADVEELVKSGGGKVKYAYSCLTAASIWSYGVERVAVGDFVVDRCNISWGPLVPCGQLWWDASV
jgi:hypothetical protein